MDQPANPSATFGINPERFWSTIERSAQIGVGRPGGLARVALTDADREMRDEFCAWCRAAGLVVTVDAVGNMFARRAGRESALAPVVLARIWIHRSTAGATTASSACWRRSKWCARLNDRAIQTPPSDRSWRCG